MHIRFEPKDGPNSCAEFFTASVGAIAEVGINKERDGITQMTSRSVVFVNFKDMRVWNFISTDSAGLVAWLSKWYHTENPLQSFCLNAGVDVLAARHSIYDAMREYKRQGVHRCGGWRFSFANQGYLVCPTYPALLVTPTNITDTTLQEASAYRSKGRLPMLCWRHPMNGATLWRSSQPQVVLRLLYARVCFSFCYVFTHF